MGLVTEREDKDNRESRPGDILNLIHGWAGEGVEMRDHRGKSVYGEQPRRMALGCLNKTKTKQKNNRPGQRVLLNVSQVLSLRGLLASAPTYRPARELR